MSRSMGDLTRGGLFSALFVVGVAHADAADVYGLWSGGDSLVSVQDDGEGGLSMRIVALKDAVYRADEGVGEAGAPRLDDRNPDVALRQRPLLGLELLVDYRFKDGRWEGRVYDPESGNTYSSRMMRDGPTLKMRGYVALPMLGRTRYFEPVAHCDAEVRELLTASAADLVMCD